jgi:hypothetical protein
MDGCRFFTGSPAAAGLITAAMLVLGACAAVPPPKTAEQLVTERAQKKWDALVKGDVEAAYGFLSPGSRAVVSLQAFKDGIRQGFWRAAKVEKAVCATPESCEAQMTIEYVVRGAKVATPMTETWIKQDAEWWFVQK